VLGNLLELPLMAALTDGIACGWEGGHVTDIRAVPVLVCLS